jgi:hypothetical protein
MDPCVTSQAYSIFLLDSSGAHKAFSGLLLEEFNNGIPHLCTSGVSYTQQFELMERGGEVVLQASRVDEHKQESRQRYVLRGGQFVETE